MRTETLLIVGAIGAYFLTQARKASAATAPPSSTAGQTVTATPGTNPGEVILSIADRVWGIASGFIPFPDNAQSAAGATPNSAANYSSDDAWSSNVV